MLTFHCVSEELLVVVFGNGVSVVSVKRTFVFRLSFLQFVAVMSFVEPSELRIVDLIEVRFVHGCGEAICSPDKPDSADAGSRCIVLMLIPLPVFDVR